MMTHKIMKGVGIIVVMVMITAVLTIGINRVRASETAAPAQTTSAQVGNSFTYQGSLEDNNVPVNGDCDFQFSLFDAATGGSQMGFTIPKSAVTVTDGIFVVDLDFGNEFTGDARYLEIAVGCPTGGINFVIIGRVALNAAPYALSLRPGAIVQGSIATTSTLQIVNENPTGMAYGLYGEVNSVESGSADVAGVYGRATASTTSGTGVYGRTDNGTGVGVYGFASKLNGETSGVYGQVWSPQGIGVYGLGIITGTYGYANTSSGVSYGVYGDTRSPDGYGVYSNGNAHVEGDLTWKAVTSYLSIPATALQPNDEAMLWDISGSGSSLYSDATNSWNYFSAPVYLPHNATVTGIKTWWADGSAATDASLVLRRIDPGTTSDMATVSTSGNSGNIIVSSSTAISNAVIDNSQYSYILHVHLPDGLIGYYQTVITYTTTGPN